MLDMISIFLNLLRFDLWLKMWSILEYAPCTLEKKVYSSAFGWKVLKIAIRSISSNVSFKTCVSLLIFYFDDLSLIHSSASDILLLIPSRVFLISVIVLFVSASVFFNSSRSLIIDSCIFPILLSRFFIIFTVIMLNFFSGT